MLLVAFERHIVQWKGEHGGKESLYGCCGGGSLKHNFVIVIYYYFVYFSRVP